MFKKAIDILSITITIGDLLADADGGEHTARLMIENAVMVPAKIRGVISMDDVCSLEMERAVIIKVNITELKTRLLGLRRNAWNRKKLCCIAQG